MFSDLRRLQALEATGMSAGKGLGMGTSPLDSCAARFKRTEGGVLVCADGNATNNWDTPPAGGWGFYDNGFGDSGSAQMAHSAALRAPSNPVLHDLITWLIVQPMMVGAMLDLVDPFVPL
eukprot:CAMPEP_0202832846 /NCGR_PEP_ID=MMETSP1389-20130828/21787_1 /ASSEMBLY_ACC=CAM_ASM_000865 /TAXON_ID=302021 /ORGANISM="Rhodomonas sp., Strain CCMP768" /LENGTH=119 /DNA_ID=CAMNT_0049507111 /DNA_START=15 /DNA_END=372 /DNA_ORIENTATION=+